jgi:general secretion pathway protein E
VSSSLIAILAQRLLRRICSFCKETYKPSATELKELAIDPELLKDAKFHQGTGCDKCFDTGYRGRIGIYELMPINEEIRELIYRRESAGKIKKKALQFGMKTLRMDGARKAIAGTTTVAEVLRITQSDTM